MAEVKVPEYGARLEERLKLEGPLATEDIRAWLTEEGLEQKQINMVLGFGAGQGRKMYHKDGDTLVAGVRPGGGQPVAGRHRGADAIPTVEEAMDRPTAQSKFQGLLESIGVDEAQAKQAGNFCFNAFDMENPSEVWQALRECPQVGQPVIKKQVWRLWTRTLRVDLPETLVQEVSTWGRTQASQPAQVGRKFFALDGQVVPTTPDDPEAMSLVDAHRLASLQKGDRPNEQAGGGLVTTLLQQQGETDRERLKLEAQKVRPEGESVTTEVIKQFGELLNSSLNKPPDTSVDARMEGQRREFELRMEAQNQRFLDMVAAQGERSQHMLEMVQQQNTHSLDLVRQAMEGNNNRPSFFEQLEQALSSKILTDFMRPPAAATSLDVYKAMREMDLKGEALSLVKTTVPELIKVGGDMAAATRELAASRGHTIAGDEAQQDDERDQEIEAPGTVSLHINCLRCATPFSYPSGAKYLLCPHCRTPQTADGHLIVPQPPPGEPKLVSGIDKPAPSQAISEDFGEVETLAPETELSPLLFGTYFMDPPPPAPEKTEEPRRVLGPVPAGTG